MLSIGSNHLISQTAGTGVISLSLSLSLSLSVLVAILLFYTVTEHSFMVSARGCPGSTCISPVCAGKV